MYQNYNSASGDPSGSYSSMSGGYAPPSRGYDTSLPGHPGSRPDVIHWFNAVDTDKSGKINAKELQSALINAQGKSFSDIACLLMISMFDRDKNGTIDCNEFQQLYMYINQWLSVFRSYDRDGSGHIEEQELAHALQQMGFRFSPDFVKFLIQKSDLASHQKMSVDQFIVVCIQIQRFTEAFRQRDTNMKGIITIRFEEFLSIALSCSI